MTSFPDSVSAPGLRSHRGRPVPSRKRSLRLVHLLVALLVLSVLGAALLAWAAEELGIPPRRLSAYVAKRADKHNAAVVLAGNWAAARLLHNDRGDGSTAPAGTFRLGAQPGPVAVSVAPTGTAPASTNVVPVDSSAAAIAAFNSAKPGDLITFAPGRYRFEGKYIAIARPGTAEHPIVVRATVPGSVQLELTTLEGFLVNAPYWHFENLGITGMCSGHNDCEHAFHVVENGAHFVARNNTVADFNAHFKINGQNGRFPDHGLIEFNTLTNHGVRQTSNPVTPIDLVAASGWIIRKNIISDFFKGEGNRVSYGAFVKGGGRNNLMENNMVLCEYHLKDPGGQQVGLSLGGGGTGREVCRDKRCVTEQDEGTIRANLIASCSDVGIYVNRSATSQIIHNTLLDTGGISVRFAESSADVEGNLVDGAIHKRDNAILRESDNMTTSMARLYLGSHPVRALLEPGVSHMLSGVPPRREARVRVPDLCGTGGHGVRAYGAFDNFADCLR